MTTAYVGLFVDREEEIISAALSAAGVKEAVIKPAVAKSGDFPLNGFLEVRIGRMDNVSRVWQEYHVHKKQNS